MFRQFLKNYKIKIILFFIATLVWFHAVTEIHYEYALWIPIEPVNIEAGKVIENKIPPKVLVKFGGKGKSLIYLRTKDVKLVLDLSNAGQHVNVALKKENVKIGGLPVEVLEIIKPTSLEVILGKLEAKFVPVVSNISVEPMDGYTLVGGIKLQPDSVVVEGPQRLVGKINEIQTEKKQYKGVKRDIAGEIKLVSFSDERITVTKRKVNFFADIQKLYEKKITDIPVKVINVPSRVKVTVVPSSLDLTVQGGIDLVTGLTKDDILAYIDYRRSRSTNGESYLATIVTPKEIRFTEVFPKSFKLIIERK